MPDHLLALQQLLLDDVGVTAMVIDRVFADELPDAQVALMPRATLVLSQAGSPNTFENGLQELSTERIDVRAYNRTPAGARNLYRAVYAVLHSLLRTTVPTGEDDLTVVHWAKKAGGPTPLRWATIDFPGEAPDPTEHWPAVNSTWQVLASTTAPQEALA